MKCQREFNGKLKSNLETGQQEEEETQNNVFIQNR